MMSARMEDQQTQNNSEYRFNGEDAFKTNNPSNAAVYLKPMKSQGVGMIEIRNANNQATADCCQDDHINHSKTKMTVGSLSITGLGL